MAYMYRKEYHYRQYNLMLERAINDLVESAVEACLELEFLNSIEFDFPNKTAWMQRVATQFNQIGRQAQRLNCYEDFQKAFNLELTARGW